MTPRAYVLASLTGVLLSSLPAAGRVSERSSYSKAQTYSTALRFLRVDRGLTVVEKDADTGYLLFAYPPSKEGTAKEGTAKESSNGSVEVIELKDGVRLVVNLPKFPEYHERVLSDGILQKLKRDYGAPPPRKPPDSGEKGREDDKGKPDEKEPDQDGAQQPD